MAASTAQGGIDPSKPGKYPVVLSDALLGKASKESYTGIKYNHKPTLSSDVAPSIARLKQSSKDSSFNLGFDDKGEKYTFNGARTTNDNQYVLVFDPARKVLVLHRLDSMFHMNVTRTPTNSDAEGLRKEFPPLDVPQPSSGSGSGASNKGQKSPEKGAGRSSTAAKGKEKMTSALRNPKDTARKPDKAKTVSLTLPDPAKAAPPASSNPRGRASGQPGPDEEEEDDDDDDDDGGLTIEYPGGEPPSTDFSPAFPAQMIGRRFSDFVRDAGEGDDDEDADADAELEDDAAGEDDDDDDDDDEDPATGGALQGGGGDPAPIDGFALPSPVNNAQPQNALGLQQHGGQQPYAAAAYASGDDDVDADLEADLEAELEREFQKASGGMDIDSESSVSEED